MVSYLSLCGNVAQPSTVFFATVPETFPDTRYNQFTWAFASHMPSFFGKPLNLDIATCDEVASSLTSPSSSWQPQAQPSAPTATWEGHPSNCLAGLTQQKSYK